MKLRLLLIGLLTLITSVTFASELSNWKPLLSVDKLHELLEEDPFAATVVDIRALDAKEPDASYNAGHIPGAISSPYATWRGQPDNPGKFITQDKLSIPNNIVKATLSICWHFLYLFIIQKVIYIFCHDIAPSPLK